MLLEFFSESRHCLFRKKFFQNSHLLLLNAFFLNLFFGTLAFVVCHEATHFVDCDILDLTNSLTCNVELFSDFLKCKRTITV